MYISASSVSLNLNEQEDLKSGMDSSSTIRPTADPLEKARRFCAYQERAQQEVRDKLYEWGCHQEEVENIIIALIEENFLNEERFAKTYARGKFRIKKWGRQKIKASLKFKKISDSCIRIGLAEINDHEYRAVLEELVEERSKKETEKNLLRRNYKIVSYLMSRGFEPDLIWDCLKSE